MKRCDALVAAVLGFVTRPTQAGITAALASGIGSWIGAVLARVSSFAVEGLDAHRVHVEFDLRPGLPAFNILGLPPASVRESRERVRAAVLNSGFAFPRQRVTANVAPAHLEKAGPSFDLALACGLLAVSQQIDRSGVERIALFAELSLSGELRPCRGVLAVAEAAARSGLRGLVVARANAAEAAQVPRLPVAGLGRLVDVTAALDGRRGFSRRGGGGRGRTGSRPAGRSTAAVEAAAAPDVAATPAEPAGRPAGTPAGAGPGGV